MIRQVFEPGAFDYVKSKGLDFVEICSNYDFDDDRIIAAVPRIKEEIAESGIGVGSMGRWNVAPFKDNQIDGAVLERQHKLIDAAHEIGSPIFVTGCAFDESTTYFRNLTMAVDYFKDLVAYTAQ